MSSMIQLLITMTSNIPGIIVALILGSWTDRIGRRPILGLPPIGHSIESVIVLMVMYFKWPIYVLFLGSLITGLCGTLPTFMTGILAYITDITDEESRPLRMGKFSIAVNFSHDILLSCIMKQYVKPRLSRPRLFRLQIFRTF